MAKFAVILPAAGKSTRFSGREKKPFALLDGRAVWLRTAELFVTRDDVAKTLLVLNPDDRETFQIKFQANIAFMNIQLVDGGAERFESVANAVAALPEGVDYVAVHDSVRPCVTTDLVDRLFDAVKRFGAVIPAVRVADTVKQVSPDQVVTGTPPRDNLWLAQTPQVFQLDLLREAYARRSQVAAPITDDAQLIESLGVKVHVLEGEPTNIKITTSQDLRLAEAILQSRPKPKAKGPIHPFADEDIWR
jgi:2-C-methyl-D-erythritol 4-phosphate cytidylyltransferase